MGAGLAQGHAVHRAIRQIQKHMARRHVGADLIGADPRQVQRDARMARAHLQHPRIAHDDHVQGLHVVMGQQFRRQFRADAPGIPQGQSNAHVSLRLE